MRSMTYTHGYSALWAEIDQPGRVRIQSAGPLSAIAREGLIADALADLAAQTKTPVNILEALVIRQSTPWPRRLLVALLAAVFRLPRNRV